MPRTQTLRRRLSRSGMMDRRGQPSPPRSCHPGRAITSALSEGALWTTLGVRSAGTRARAWLLAGASPHGFPPANATETRSGRIGIAAVAAAVAMDATLALAVGDGAGARAAGGDIGGDDGNDWAGCEDGIDVSTFAITFGRIPSRDSWRSWLRWRWIPWSPRGRRRRRCEWRCVSCRHGQRRRGRRRTLSSSARTHDGGRCVLVGRGDRGGNCRDSFCRGRQVRATRARASGEGGVMKFRQSVKRRRGTTGTTGNKDVRTLRYVIFQD